MFKCKICGKTYTDLPGMYSHIEKKHMELVPKNMSVPQYYYFMKTGKTNGNCVMCKQPTTWNKNTSKYNRFCTNPACKEKYVAEFKKRMIAKYGKVHLLNDPAKQREMLANRKISGKYRWADGTETVYTGSFELDLLKLLDLFMEWDPVDISMPSPHTYTYMYEGEEHYYIPDAFIHSLDLEIEVKDGGDNPNMHHKIRDVDKVKEKLKDEVLMSQKSFHYIKITNKNYTNFFNFLKKAKEGFAKYEDEKKMPRIFLIEDIKTKSTNTKTLYEATEVEDNEEIVDSYDIDINHEDYQQVKEFAKGLEVDVLVTESFVDNLSKTIKDLSKISVLDLEELVMLNFNAKKNDPEAIKKYLKKLIKGCKTEKDMIVVRNLMKMYITHSEKLSKDDPTKKALEIEYKTWVMGEYQKEFNKKWKKITESFDYIEYQEEDILEEGRMGISELESLIYHDYDAMKGNNKRVQKYVFRLLKGCKTKKDLSIVKKLVSMHKSYLSTEASKGNKKYAEMENDFRIWVKTNFTPELEKKSSVIKESIEIEDFEILEEGLNLPIPNIIKKVINKKLDNFASMSDKDIDKTKLESVKKEDIKKCRDLVKSIRTIMKAVKTVKAVKFVLDLIKYTFIFFQAHKIANLITDDEAFNAELAKFAKIFKIDPKDVMWDFSDKDVDEAITETFDVDKSLVWLDKPLSKATNKTITLYHGSIDDIKDKHLTPSGVNVGATKFSNPRWSTYYWDDLDNAITWGMTWAIKRAGFSVAYKGAQGKTVIGKEGYTGNELSKELLKHDIKSFVYEVRIPANKLEIGPAPSIKEYTLSEETDIYKKTKIQLTSAILNKYFDLGTVEEVQEVNNNIKVDNLIGVRGRILNQILNHHRDPYRKIVRDDVKKGTIRVGDDLSMYKNVINKAVKDDLYQLKEGAISFSKLNDLLADKDHKRLAKYMDDYESFYKKTLKENPTKSKNINTEITRARKYIEDLGRTGKVNNDLVKYAVERIDHSGLCVRPRMESAGNIVSLSIVIGADTKRKSFGLNDTESKIFINDDYSIRRPDSINSMNCILCPDNLEDNIQGKRVFKYEVKMNNGGVELGDVIDRYSTDTVSIPGLFNLNEANNCKFIKDVCFQLGLTNCELELVSDTVY